MHLQFRIVWVCVLAPALLLIGCRPLQRLTGYTPQGLEELDAARSMGNGELGFSDELRSRFQMPTEIDGTFEAREWLLRRATEIGRDDVQVSARLLLAYMVEVSNCAEAEQLLEQNVGDGASQRLLSDLRQNGCEAVLRRFIAGAEANFIADPATKNELALEWVTRARRQLEGIEQGKARGAGERP